MDITIDNASRALADVAHARIKIPLNLDHWRHLPAEVTDRLLWFHQHALDTGLDGEAAAAVLGFREANAQGELLTILKGTYTGDWKVICERIDHYKRDMSERAGILRGEFVETPVSAMIWAALDYASANNSITLIEGGSGHGKTIASERWRDDHNHGRTVMVEAPPIGGVKELLRLLCEKIGGNRRRTTGDMLDAILRAFNSQRMLIVDEATRLLPKGTGTPDKLEFLRYLHDRTGCALALIATRRFNKELGESAYMFEQVLGRVGMPVRLPALLDEAAYRPLVVQYFPRPSAKLLETCGQLANDKLPRQQGRLRLLNQVLRLSSRFAHKAKRRLVEDDFYKALALRAQMMGREN